jgi:alkylation response protein AidB-like acyl-CoA dehydrogenase
VALIEETRLPSGTPAPEGTLLERVERLRPIIEAGGDEAQRLRRVPQETVDALVDAGLFRFTIPCELGGEDASSLQTIEVIEAISAIDGSVGWNVMLGSEINAMAAGNMEPEVAKQVYLDDPRVIMCGAGGGPAAIPPKGFAQPDGGFRVTGQISFVSGCHNAGWCFMAGPVFDGDELRRDAKGNPVVLTFFMHRSQWEIVDTWDVASLRGSGSNDVRADGAIVPPEHAGIRLWALPARYDNPVHRMPTYLRLAYNKAAVAIGIAKGALGAFTELAAVKTPALSTSLLRDRPLAQQRMGEATASLRAARAYLFEAMGAVEDELRTGREVPSAATTQDARLACTHAAQVSMSVVDLMHNAAGTSAIYVSNPLERKLRDAHGAASHRWVSAPLYGDLGKILLGHPPTPEFS